MKHLVLMLLVLLTVGAAFAVENQAFLGVFAETRGTKMVGMPDMSEMLKNIPADMLAKNPAMAGMMGGAQRLLTVRLWSPGIAAKDAFATLAIPAGLKLGPKLDLALYRPEAEKGTAGGQGGIIDDPNFTIKYYWGSSPTVKAGQPEIITMKGLSPEAKARMRASAEKASKGSYYYKPDWTTGYWPTKQQGPIDKEAVMVGNYSLTTNYTGNVAIDVPAEVSFLAPLEITAPKLDKVPDLTKAMAFNWNVVPNILGYHMMIMGMQGKNTLIIWCSSESRPALEIDWDYMQMSEVRELVQKNILMAPERNDVTVPANIFTQCDFVNMMMIGYGPGAALGEGQPLPRVQTKTTLTMMLGGKEMKKMGAGMGDMGDMGDAGNTDGGDE